MSQAEWAKKTPRTEERASARPSSDLVGHVIDMLYVCSSSASTGTTSIRLIHEASSGGILHWWTWLRLISAIWGARSKSTSDTAGQTDTLRLECARHALVSCCFRVKTVEAKTIRLRYHECAASRVNLPLIVLCGQPSWCVAGSPKSGLEEATVISMAAQAVLRY